MEQDRLLQYNIGNESEDNRKENWSSLEILITILQTQLFIL